MSKILITGLSGFTGQHLAHRLLEDGHRVFGISKNNSSHSKGVHQADLNSFDELACALQEIKPDKIIHLAAVAFVAHVNVEEIYRVNLLGTRNLLSAVSELSSLPSHILIASSANVYGNATSGTITEDALPSPANDYAVSKLAMEYMVQTWRNVLPVTIVRPFNYTGIGQSEKFLIPKIVKHFKEKADVIELGNLDVTRDFSDVRDVVDAYVRLINTSAQSEVYNVCSGVGTSLAEIIEIMKSISGHDIEVRVNPAFVRKNEIKTLVGSDQKLTNHIGSRAKYPIRDTLEWMYKNI